jgi:hypothetical protein
MHLPAGSVKTTSARSKRPSLRSSGRLPISRHAIGEINAYIAIRDGLLVDAEEDTTWAKLGSVRLANDFVTDCVQPARHPYEAQALSESDAARERKRCAAVNARITQLRGQLAAQ